MTPAERAKKYRDEHKEQIAEREKKYREEHKEQRSITNALWREKNKEHRSVYMKEYNEKNKEKIVEKRQSLYTCACGTEIKLASKYKHETTNKHRILTCPIGTKIKMGMATLIINAIDEKKFYCTYDKTDEKKVILKARALESATIV